jgi:hypothetical protein
MPTWVKETDTAIYLMEGAFYLEKIAKTPRPNGEKDATIMAMKQWFNRPDPPGRMIIAVGTNSDEPLPKPPSNGGHTGAGPGTDLPKPRVTLILAHPNNFRARRSTFKIDTIVIHNTVSSTESTINTFQNPASEVSAHYLIDRSGEIIQLVNDRDCAYHAGNKDMNDRSFGIEHEATPQQRGLTAAQEKSSISLIKFLLDAYDIPANRIISHRGVETPPFTECPNLIFPTEAAFRQWVNQHFRVGASSDERRR